MDAEEKLRANLSPILHSVVHAVACLVLHLTGAHRLPEGEVQRLRKLLKTFLESIDALP